MRGPRSYKLAVAACVMHVGAIGHFWPLEMMADEETLRCVSNFAELDLSVFVIGRTRASRHIAVIRPQRSIAQESFSLQLFRVCRAARKFCQQSGPAADLHRDCTTGLLLNRYRSAKAFSMTKSPGLPLLPSA